MDPLSADIIWTQRVITRAVLQVKLLNRHLAEIQARYDHAQGKQMLLWVYKLRMRALTVEGVKNVFMQFLEEKMVELEELHEQQYWQDIQDDDDVSQEEEEDDTSVRSISESDWDTSIHSAQEPDHDLTSSRQGSFISRRTSVSETSFHGSPESEFNTTLQSLEGDESFQSASETVLPLNQSSIILQTGL